MIKFLEIDFLMSKITSPSLMSFYMVKLKSKDTSNMKSNSGCCLQK